MTCYQINVLFHLQHDETMRRHSQLMEQKREKAIELSMLRHYRTSDVAPQQKPYSKKKFCSLCNVLVSDNLTSNSLNKLCILLGFFAITEKVTHLLKTCQHILQSQTH